MLSGKNILQKTYRSLLKPFIFNKNNNISIVRNSSFLQGENGFYTTQMYEKWRVDPTSVHASWDSFFTNIDSGMDISEAYNDPPTLGQKTKGVQNFSQSPS